MAQFDLHCLKGGQLVVDLQTDLIGIDASRIVAPLREVGRYASFPGLTPTVEHNGSTWIVRVQEIAAVPGVELRNRVGSLADHRDAWKRAFQFFDPCLLSRRLAWPFAAITLGLAHPNAKAVRRTAQFTCDRRQRRSFAPIIIAVFRRQPLRAFAELRLIRLRGLLLLCMFHDGQSSESFALR